MKHFHEIVLSSMNLGYFCGKIIYDEVGKQVDIEFVDVSTIFEKIVGIAAMDMIGNRASKLLYTGGQHDYDISNLLLDIRGLYGEQEIEIHKPRLNKWYHFHKISFENDFIGVTMEDITEIKNLYNEKKRK